MTSKKATSDKTDVAKIETPALPAQFQYDIEDMGAGLDDLSATDLQVPFIGIMQKGSPQVEEENAKYIAGAKAGMLFNTVTQDLYDGKTGITVIPVHRTRQYIEWIPKDDGGGLVAVYEPDDPTVLKALSGGQQYGAIELDNGNELVETFSVFALVVSPDGNIDRVVVSFSSTQIATYKRWMTMASSVQLQTGDGRRFVPPMFAHRYRLSTQFTSKKDYTWYKFGIAWDGDDATSSRLGKDDELYQAARAFRQMVVGGQVKAQYERTDEHETEAEVTYDM